MIEASVIRVVIAEDEAITREALTALLGLEAAIDVVASTGRGDRVRELIESHRADLVVLDLTMPGMTGLEVAEELHRERTGFPVVVLTSHGRPGEVQRALGSGVRGFLTKETSADKLVRVIREVHGGGRYIDQELATDALSAGHNPLTPREVQILRCLEDGRPVRDVADEVNVSEGTVRNHISSAIRKLGVSNRATACRQAAQAGWI
ncbi:response regulator transcription factor [Streptomyces sp. N2-109]|uniref:Response regulator transcription factor n=1 Tax=Streptomyces gossypii TaxID=2883101 RepID=A0ABT2K025_9ACTN|nr:response regulator transcription factor [Streptomyces gossypii]MCT2593268.1 response regulator transcription factor [Streptomyces gossypii]